MGHNSHLIQVLFPTVSDIDTSGYYVVNAPKLLDRSLESPNWWGPNRRRSGPRHQSLARTERAPQLHHRPLSPAAAGAARIPFHRYRGLNNSRGEARRSRLPPLGRSLCHRFVRRRGASPGRGAALSKALMLNVLIVKREIDLAWNAPLAYVKIKRRLQNPCQVGAMRDVDN